jgi:hypothetical protein
MIEPEFSFRQFFDFRFGVNASRFFNLPHPIQTLHNLRDPRCPSRNLLLPSNVRLLSRADFVEWLATAPSLSLTPPPGWIVGRFALPSPGRKSPASRCMLLNLLVAELFDLVRSAVELAIKVRSRCAT